jgi:hypothetical protein
VADPIEVLAAVLGGLSTTCFGAGVAYMAVKNSVKAARIEAATAIAMAQDCLARIAVEKDRSSKQGGAIDLHAERIANIRNDVDGLLATVFRSRFESDRAMQAVQSAKSRQDIPRQDSDAPPPLPPGRGRLGSIRRE